MSDLYNMNSFLLQTKARMTLDHEISSKKPLKFDFIIHPTNENKIWMNLNTLSASNERKTQSAFGMSLMLGQKYRVKTKLFDFRSPKISLSSTLPLLKNIKYFIKFSPRSDEQDNIYALIGFSRKSNLFAVTAGLLIQDGFYALSKAAFYPWKGLFLRSFVNFNFNRGKVVDYTGIIGYEHNNSEFFIKQTTQDKTVNRKNEFRGIAIGCWHRYSSNLALAFCLISNDDKEAGSPKEKAIIGFQYQISEGNSLKFKIANNLSYSILYKHKFNDQFKVALRFIDKAQSNDLMANRLGINLIYELD